MTKGSDTKSNILKAGLDMASQVGLEWVTIGTLAKTIGLSKSGLFAHFQSKENLQIEILNYAAEDFTQNVIIPSLKSKAGIPRIKALVDLWIDWGSKLKGGCIFVTAGTEYSDRPGKVRDCLLSQQEAWIDSLKRIAHSAIKIGDFSADIDLSQFAFDLYSMLLGFHYYYKLLNQKDTKKRLEMALNQLLLKYIKTENPLAKSIKSNKNSS